MVEQAIECPAARGTAADADERDVWSRSSKASVSVWPSGLKHLGEKTLAYCKLLKSSASSLACLRVPSLRTPRKKARAYPTSTRYGSAIVRHSPLIVSSPAFVAFCNADPDVLATAPVYQFQHYYKFGKADDCSGHWSNFYSCLKSRTKFKVQVCAYTKLYVPGQYWFVQPSNGMCAQAVETPKHPLWNIRSKEEAEQYWKTQYGAANYDGGSKKAEKQ